MLSCFFSLRSYLNNTVLIITVVGILIGNHGIGGVTHFPNYTWHITYVCACSHIHTHTHTVFSCLFMILIVVMFPLPWITKSYPILNYVF